MLPEYAKIEPEDFPMRYVANQRYEICYVKRPVTIINVADIDWRQDRIKDMESRKATIKQETYKAEFDKRFLLMSEEFPAEPAGLISFAVRHWLSEHFDDMFEEAWKKEIQTIKDL